MSTIRLCELSLHLRRKLLLSLKEYQTDDDCKLDPCRVFLFEQVFVVWGDRGKLRGTIIFIHYCL